MEGREELVATQAMSPEQEVISNLSQRLGDAYVLLGQQALKISLFESETDTLRRQNEELSKEISELKTKANHDENS